jgi:hypothetical protein
MDTLQLQILAGVPITSSKNKPVVESMTDRKLTKTLKGLITNLDDASYATKNREDKSEYNECASDLEDILISVKSGKRKKAQKMYQQISSKMKLYISNKLGNNSNTFEEYFNTITEDTVDPEISDAIDTKMELNSDNYDNPNDTEDISEDSVKCPFCSCGTDIPKSEFYDHIMDNHIEDEIESDIEEPTEFDIDLGPADEITIESAEDATVWDKTNDKDESPSSYPIDDDKIKLPKNIKSALEKEIKQLQKSSEELVKTDFATAEFQNTTANAMIEVLDHLSKETETGMKMAQVCITKYMSPIVQKFPKDVYDFILHGGYDMKRNTKNSLVSMFKEIKNK